MIQVAPIMMGLRFQAIKKARTPYHPKQEDIAKLTHLLGSDYMGFRSKPLADGTVWTYAPVTENRLKGKFIITHMRNGPSGNTNTAVLCVNSDWSIYYGNQLSDHGEFNLIATGGDAARSRHSVLESGTLRGKAAMLAGFFHHLPDAASSTEERNQYIDF